MILLAAFLLLVAVGCLVVGLAEGSTALQWSSFAASALAAVVLAAGEVRRRRAGRRGPADVPTTTATTTGATITAAAGPAGPVPPESAAPEPVLPAPPARAEPPAVAHAPAMHAPAGTGPDGEPPVEEVEVTDLLVVLDLTDEVFVIDEHPRYHLAGCPYLAGQPTFPMPMVEARTDGFTPCGTCAPDRHLARVERSRRSGR
ncbi:hypothetical protein SAMN05661080_01854 [Modestobacter sp. DSM 44400]|uniref:hypothetical protein n=1 Tax=Modestobacter sp. DSM 44400 TaxID=1550230 RepID=UPI00089D96CB|nr:hypothetical protein [Modestobacter sp. DSM 44400]SDX95880.1 hypothetical protein SAMN05661080_01854 [Modestobacter sp. DSM 44400]